MKLNIADISLRASISFTLLVISSVLHAESLLLSVTPNEFTKGIIWRIDKAGVESSYLLGTMHTDGPGIRKVLGEAQPYLHQVKTVCTEIKMDFEALAVELRAMFFTDGRSLEEVLDDPPTYLVAMQKARMHGLDPAMVRYMKPFTLAFILSMPMTQGEVLDSQIYNQALRANKQVCGLETIEEHQSTFLVFDMPAQISILKNTLTNYDEYKALAPLLLDAYLQRDLQKIITLASPSMFLGDKAITQTFVQRFLIDRNHLMVKRMQPYLQAGAVFFAVGAMHLTGEEGILQLLQKRGYSISVIY